LSGRVIGRISVRDVNLCVGCQCCMFACSRRFGDAGLGRSAIHVGSAGGVERGFIVYVCRGCPDPPCMKVCPTDALVKRPHGGVILERSRCIGCGSCVEACTLRAIFWDREKNKPIICVHCGICVSHCPYGVLKIEPTMVDER
jgi:Fe-S-cluster-containing dehydrogenase component